MGNQVHSKDIFNFKGKALRMRFVGSLGKTVLVVMCKMKKIEHLSTFIFKILFLLSEAGGEFIKKFCHTHQDVFTILITKVRGCSLIQNRFVSKRVADPAEYLRGSFSSL